MSSRSGDRARANKQKTKRRLRRSLLRPLRKHSDPGATAAGSVQPASPEAEK